MQSYGTGSEIGYKDNSEGKAYAILYYRLKFNKQSELQKLRETLNKEKDRELRQIHR